MINFIRLYFVLFTCSLPLGPTSGSEGTGPPWTPTSVDRISIYKQ